MTKRLTGKVGLVTGGGSGIGQATAWAFAREGAKVVVADLSIEGGEETVHQIKAAHGDALFIQTNVTESFAVKSLLKKTIQVFGSLNFAFNNAGIEGDRAFSAACTEENWDRVMNVNLKGIWLCMKYEIPYMREQGGGTIVNMASIAGLSGGLLGFPAYTASKHGVIGLTKAAAVEYAKSNIRINAICPGFTKTPMLEKDPERLLELETWVETVVPAKRLVKPEEIAESVVWLCSAQSAFVTGQALAVDGGFIAQ
jgi:NAD(P)-dependent dehydrogenase (short-subunit alcohol dehydrogenase family)